MDSPGGQCEPADQWSMQDHSLKVAQNKGQENAGLAAVLLALNSLKSKLLSYLNYYDFFSFVFETTARSHWPAAVELTNQSQVCP